MDWVYNMEYHKIPDEIKQYPQWVLWRFEDTDGEKPTKVPYSPIDFKHAKVNDSATWGTFEQCVGILKSPGWYSGLGFVLTEQDPYCFIDLDDTKNDKSKMDRQIKIYNEFDSYAEKSPSGKGLHIIVRGSEPSGRKRGSIEIYSNLRYMTMTGKVYRNKPIVDYNDLANALHSQMATNNQNGLVYAGLAEQKETDEEVYRRAFSASNGLKFSELWDGKWQNYYPSQSEADFALIDILAWYTQNRAQIVRLFRMSELGKREKAQRDDYLNYMLNKCFDRMLPPVDVEGLQNQIRSALESKLKKEPEIQEEEPELKAETEIYTPPEGLLGSIAQFIYAQAPRQVAEIALAGAIGMMSGIVGRAYNVSGTGLNQYTLLLAPTGTGKESIASGIDKLFQAILKTVPSANDFLGPAEISSSQAVIKYMSNGPKSFTSLVGEFGIYMSQMANPNAPPHLLGLRRFLLDAYNKSGEGKVLRPTIYSDKANNTREVKSPAFSILGESTPEKFYEGLHEGLISEGLLPRFTLIEYSGHRPPLNANFKLTQPSFDLIEKLSTLCAHCLMLNSQDKAINVEFEPGAEQIFFDFDKKCDLEINSSSKEIRRQLWNRAHVKSMKLAAIIAVGENPYNPKINSKSAKWAINLITHDCKKLLKKFDLGEIGIDNDEAKQIARLVEAVKDFVVKPWSEVRKTVTDNQQVLHSHKIVPFSYIQRKIANLSVYRKDRIGGTNALKRAIQTLCDRGDLQEMSRAELSKNYNTTARAFMISNTHTFI
jgi:hypothetical protein